MTTVKVWGEGRVGLWSYGDTHDIPHNYALLLAGDGPRTRGVLKAAKQQGVTVYTLMENLRRGYSRKLGIWVPANLLHLDVKRTSKERLAELRRTKQEREVTNFIADILTMYPRCPPEEARKIAAHACEIGSGRVGRSRTAEDPVRAAVVAYVRHNRTDYDSILAEGEDRDVARQMVRMDINNVIRSWESPSDDGETKSLSRWYTAIPWFCLQNQGIANLTAVDRLFVLH